MEVQKLNQNQQEELVINKEKITIKCIKCHKNWSIFNPFYMGEKTNPIEKTRRRQLICWGDSMYEWWPDMTIHPKSITATCTHCRTYNPVYQ